MRFNPYFPGAGQMPSYLSGRDEELNMFREEITKISFGLPPRAMALYGLRGVGKTALLLKMREIAKENQWMAPLMEVTFGKSIRTLLSDALDEYLLEYARPGLKDRIVGTALKTASLFRASVGNDGVWSFGIDLSDISGSNAASGDIDNDLFKVMRDTSLLAKKNGIGLAIFIDEAQDLNKEDLAAISTLAHKAGQDSLPILVVLAGLPSLPKVLADSKSYAERLYRYCSIGKLTENQAKAALIEPAAGQQVSFDEDAEQYIVKQTGGYPYFIQEYGFHIWKAFPNVENFHLDMIYSAEKEVAQALDQGFFKSRWDRASQGQKDFLRAMSQDGETSFVSDIAARLDKKLSAISPVRAELIKKGLIYQVAPGKVAFTVPRMEDFISRQLEV